MRNIELANQPMNREQRRAEEKAKKNKKSTMRNVFIRVSAKNHTKDGDVTYTKEDIQKILDEWSQKKKMSFYFIEHNEDEDNVHFHIVIEFAHPTAFDVVKNHFPYGSIQECLQSYDGRGKVQYSVQYLIHMNHPNKYQYKWEDVITNNLAKLEEYKVPHSMKLNARLKILLDKILNGEIREYEIEKIEPDLYIKKYREIRKAFEYRQNIQCKDQNRNIVILGIIGPPRLGKTTFIKEYAKKNNKSICLSSSSNDPWTYYKGQDIFVLDDADFDNISIEDMMKMVDPQNNTGAKSRYYNKLFVGEMIVVISNIPVDRWYYIDADDKHREALLKRFDYFFDFNIEQDKLDKHISQYTIKKFTGDYEESDVVIDSRGNVVHSYKKFDLTPIEGNKIHEFNMTNYIDFSTRKQMLDEFIKTVNEM